MLHRTILFFLLFISTGITPSFAHPHVFVDCTAQMIFSEKGLTGIRVAWIFDEMSSSQYLMDLDGNGDGMLSTAEWDSLKTDISGFLAEQSFFVHIKINGKSYPVTNVKNFLATYTDGMLTYSLTVPILVPYANGNTNMQVAIYDPSFYTDFYTSIDSVTVEGATMPVSLDVDDAPELAFYSGQVIPIAARLTF